LASFSSGVSHGKIAAQNVMAVQGVEPYPGRRKWDQKSQRLIEEFGGCWK
jgi:hypothetical protein